MGVVVGGAEDLAAGHVLEDGGDAALDLHGAGVDGAALGEAGEGGAIGAEEEGGLDEVALGLEDGAGGEFGVVAGAFAHDAVDGAAELGLDLAGVEEGEGGVAAALGGEPGVGGVDGALAAFHCDVGHYAGSTFRVRGRAATWSPAQRMRSTPRGKRAWLAAHWAAKSGGRPVAWKLVGAWRPGPAMV